MIYLCLTKHIRTIAKYIYAYTALKIKVCTAVTPADQRKGAKMDVDGSPGAEIVTLAPKFKQNGGRGR